MKVVPNTQVNMLLIGHFTVYSQSCNEVEACKDLDDDDIVTISERSCNSLRACIKHTGYFFVSSDSCNGVEACYGGESTLEIGPFSCNGKDAVSLSLSYHLSCFNFVCGNSSADYALLV